MRGKLNSDIQKENKIPGSPGCDKLTRPEEITALSKFLKKVREVQEEHVNLDQDNIELTGSKETNGLAEVSNLPQYIDQLLHTDDKLSNVLSKEGVKIQERNQGLQIKPAAEKIPGKVKSTPLSEKVEKIDSKKEKINLSSDLDKLDVAGDKLELPLDVEGLEIVDRQNTLSTEVDRLEIKEEGINLSSDSVGLENINPLKNLSVKRDLLEVRDDVLGLREDKERLSTSQANLELPKSTSNTIIPKEVSNLGEEKESLQNTKGDVGLNKEVDKLDVLPKVPELKSYRDPIQLQDKLLDLSTKPELLVGTEGSVELSKGIEKIEGDKGIEKLGTEVSKLNPGKTDINLPKEAERLIKWEDAVKNLSNYREDISGRNDIPLSDYRENIQDQRENTLPDTKERIETNHLVTSGEVLSEGSSVNNLSDYKDNIVDGREPNIPYYRDDLVDQRETTLSDTKEKIESNHQITSGEVGESGSSVKSLSNYRDEFKDDRGNSLYGDNIKRGGEDKNPPLESKIRDIAKYVQSSNNKSEVEVSDSKYITISPDLIKNISEVEDGIILSSQNKDAKLNKEGDKVVTESPILRDSVVPDGKAVNSTNPNAELERGGAKSVVTKSPELKTTISETSGLTPGNTDKVDDPNSYKSESRDANFKDLGKLRDDSEQLSAHEVKEGTSKLTLDDILNKGYEELEGTQLGKLALNKTTWEFNKETDQSFSPSGKSGGELKEGVELIDKNLVRPDGEGDDTTPDTWNELIAKEEEKYKEGRRKGVFWSVGDVRKETPLENNTGGNFTESDLPSSIADIEKGAADLKNPVRKSNENKESDAIGYKTAYDQLYNYQKDKYKEKNNPTFSLLNDPDYVNNLKEDELFEAVMNLYRTLGKTDDGWSSRISPFISTYLSGSSKSGVLKSEPTVKALLNEQTRIIEEDGKKIRLASARLGKGNNVERPGYEKPGNVIDTLIDPSSNIRWAAEQAATVATSPFGKGSFKGSLREELLRNFLHLAIKKRSQLEWLTKASRDRLPGDGGDSLLSKYVRSGGELKNLVKSMKNGNWKSTISNSLGIISKYSTKRDSPTNRPKLVDSDKAEEFRNDYEGRPAGSRYKETTYFEFNNSRDEESIPATVEGENIKQSLKEVAAKRAKTFYDQFVKDKYNTSDSLDFAQKYLTGNGILRTIGDLIGKDVPIESVEDLQQALQESPWISTASKYTSFNGRYKSTTLDYNANWEIRLAPYVYTPRGSSYEDVICNNNGFSYLPSISEINVRNWYEFNKLTAYTDFIPVSSFELQHSKMTSKEIALYDGSISIPMSMEFLNELRLTFVDDIYKSWRWYFERCMKAATYNSEYHLPGFYKEDTPNITAIDQSSIAISPYKNVTFQAVLYIMTPQYEVIKKYNFLLTLKEFTEEHQGDTEASQTELNVTFSIVGEGPKETRNEAWRF